MSSACRCSRCYGLREHMLDLTGKDYGLPAAPGHEPVRLRILTPDPEPPASLAVLVVPECDGSMTCDCAGCDEVRAKRVARGVRSSPTRGIPVKRAA